MKLKDLIDVIDPNMEGFAWLNFIDHNDVLMCKANSCSSFLIPLYDRAVICLDAAEKGVFDVYIEGEI